jgi:hypothetical protein
MWANAGLSENTPRVAGDHGDPLPSDFLALLEEA